MHFKNYYKAYLFLLPSFVLLACFVFYPAAKTLLFSFSYTNAHGSPVHFAGLEIYTKLFTSPQFWHTVSISLFFAVLVGLPALTIGFVLALLANVKIKGSKLYETLFTLPMAIASAPAATMWFLILSPGENGILNYLLGTNFRWLLSPSTAIYAVGFVTVWLAIGINFIFLTVGLRNVPAELLESANLDGANFFQSLFRVIIPVASPQIFFVIFFDIVSSFQSFAQIRLLTEGGPSYSTNVLVYSIYRAAILDGRFEQAFALSVVLFLIIMVITSVQLSLEKKLVHYR